MPNRLPFEIREAVVQVFGKAFWYKDPLRSFLLGAGVSVELYERYADEAKFKIGRHLLAELDRLGEEGWLLQRRIVTELCKLRNVPDPGVPDRDGAVAALRYLKELALAQEIVAREETSTNETRLREAQMRQAAIAARAQRTEQLRATFSAMVTSREDPQGRGYGLEDLIGELCDLHEVPYRPPYRTETEQIDGYLLFEGFDYLIEARWRLGPPSLQDLTAFKGKVDRKLESTRGLFLSIPGFRPEVVTDFMRGGTANVILVDGQDLTLVLEGQVSLVDALKLKIQKAVQEGIIYFPLAQR